MDAIGGLSVAVLAMATLIMAIGAALQAAVGIGMALLVVPTLALLDPRLVPGPMLAASIVLAVAMAVRERSAIDARGLGLSLVGLAAGTVIGAVALRYFVPQQHVPRFFGVMVLIAVIVSASGVTVRPTRPALWIGGCTAGVMGTMVGIHGPPIALVLQGAPPQQVRAMLGGFFAVLFRP